LEESKRIVEVILAEAERKAGEILESARREAESLLQGARISGAEEKENILRQGRIKAQELFRERLMAARLENRRRFLLKREELLLRVWEEVRRRLKDFAGSREYADWMERELERAGAELGAELEVEVREEDLGLLERLRENLRRKGLKIRVGAPTHCSGGFRARTPDGKLLVDQTFERRLERLGEETRAKIAKAMFG